MKRFFSIFLTAIILVCTLASCAESKDLMKPFKKEETGNVIDPSKYMELGKYIGLEIELIEPEVVTDEMVENAINQTLYNYSETEKVSRPVEEGDLVIVDYIGYVDGKTADNLQASGEEIVIGLGNYIPGFESGMVGMKEGDTKDIDLTFPKDYAAELAGKDVTFTVTIHEVYKVTLPELTDEFVKETLMYDDVETYRQYVRESMEQSAQSTAQSAQVSALWKAARENSNIFDYPQEEIDSYIADYTDYYTTMASYSGASLDDYLKSTYGIGEEEFIAEITEWAKEDIGTRMIILAIVEKENMTITDEEYQEAKANLLAQYGVTEEQFESSYGQTIEEFYGKQNIELNVLGDRVYDLIDQNAVYVNK